MEVPVVQMQSCWTITHQHFFALTNMAWRHEPNRTQMLQLVPVHMCLYMTCQPCIHMTKACQDWTKCCTIKTADTPPTRAAIIGCSTEDVPTSSSYTFIQQSCGQYALLSQTICQFLDMTYSGRQKSASKTTPCLAEQFVCDDSSIWLAVGLVNHRTRV